MRVEGFAHIFLFQVNGGQHNVARRLIPKLDNPLAQIGIYHLDSVLNQVRIQVAFLRQHRLAFDDARSALLLNNIENNGVVLRRISGPVHMHAIGLRGGLKLLQVQVEPAQGVVFDAGGQLAQLLEFGHGVHGAVALLAHKPQGFVVPGGAVGIQQKFVGAGGVVHQVDCWSGGWADSTVILSRAKDLITPTPLGLLLTIHR